MDKHHPFNYLFVMLTIFVCGSLLFLIGFFPISQNQLEGVEHKYNKEKNLRLFDINLRKPPLKHDQVIFMIIDAWRYDFVNATNMPFSHRQTCNLINVIVEAPTVTMPRLKSMTTGTISNFMDVVLNLGEVGELDDSLLHRVNDVGKKIIFAGDRTWSELFPTLFLRNYVNMDSFFVNDFYEGDKNITGNAKVELEFDDWHLLVLHYLGLDHIGHVEGSHSTRIFDKLLEMDKVISDITRNSKFKNKVLLVTADHGMRNGGSHGSSEKEEISVPLLLFSDKCIPKRASNEEAFNQIDITPTLAIMLGADIPHSSVGCLITDILDDYTMEEQLYYYYYNTLHLVEKFRKTFTLSQIQAEGQSDYYFWLTEAEMDHKHFIQSNGTSLLSYEKAKQNYIRASKNISQRLSEALVKYDNDLIVISLILTTLTALSLVFNVLFESRNSPKQLQNISLERMLLCAFLAAVVNGIGHYFILITPRHFFYSISLTVPLAISIYLAIDIWKLIIQILVPLTFKESSNFKLTIPWMLLSFFLLHTISLGSSSLIEEEHQIWYYFTPTLFLFLSIQNFYNNVKKIWKSDGAAQILASQLWNMRFVAVLMIVIIGCRRLNPAGNKWRYLRVIADFLAEEKNFFYLTLLFVAALFLLYCFLRKYNTPLQMGTCTIALICVFIYRKYDGVRFLILVIFWLSVFITGLIHYRDACCKPKNYGYETSGNLVELLRTNLTCCLLVSALLHKPHNVILLPALLFTLEQSYQLCDNLHMKDGRIYNRCYVLVFKTVLTIFVSNMFYFFQGNSNSLSTIDLNPGYIGQSSYNALVAGAFITLNTYCAHINAFLYLMWHMFATQKTCLPLRQEKEQISNAQLLGSTEEDLNLVISLFTATTVMPVAVYWLLLLGFRYHLFIYSVFAPKAFYECFHILVFYFNFIVTNLYFRLFQKY